MKLRVVVAAIGVAVTACLSAAEPLPLDIGLQASRVTAAPGDTINFLVSAQGGNLIGVEMDYGDGSADSFVTSGARTAHITFKHAFNAVGAFLVDAKVTDSDGSSKNASIQVNVN